MTWRATSGRPYRGESPRLEREALVLAVMVGRCKLKPVEPSVESACFQLLKLKCHTVVSSFAVEVNCAAT